MNTAENFEFVIEEIKKIELLLKDTQNLNKELTLKNKELTKQLTLGVVSQRSELLPDFLYKDDYGIKIGYYGDTEVSEEWNDYLKKSGNCG